MSKYLHLFETQAEKEAAYDDSDIYEEPWVSYVQESGNTGYNKVPEPGDIVYYNGSALKYCKQASWSLSLGTPVAIVVVPSVHTPDGTVRCMSYTYVKSDGTSSYDNTFIGWGPTGVTDTGLPNFNSVPIWNNTIGGAISSGNVGDLSSNNTAFTGTTDCLDNNLRYKGTYATRFIPNPYLPDGLPNPDYRNVAGTTTGNCLSDFNGAANTSILVSLGPEYSAANACHLYSTSGIPAGQWYLPAMGELGYIYPRWNQIQSALSLLYARQLDYSRTYWSSTECDRDLVFYLGSNAIIKSYYKNSSECFRPFCSLPPNLGF